MVIQNVKFAYKSIIRKMETNIHCPFNYAYITYGKMRIEKSYRDGQPPVHNHIQFTGFKTIAGFFFYM